MVQLFVEDCLLCEKYPILKLKSGIFFAYLQLSVKIRKIYQQILMYILTKRENNNII